MSVDVSQKGKKMVGKIEENRKSKLVIYLTYFYIMLPFMIFAAGWIGKRYCIFIVPLLIVCFWRACSESNSIWIPEINRSNFTKIIFIIAVIFIWVYYSGIGRLVFQNTDHNCRNAIFEVLVEYEWPVYNYNVDLSKFPEGTTATSLVYYIGFWLPSAVVGKIFGVEAGYGFQVFWAVLGIVLVYYYLCARKEKLLVWPLAILIFFSGLDIVGQYFRGVDLFTMANDIHIEWWMEPYQYSSITTQLYWVFNQAIPAWLCTVFAYVQKNNRSLMLILACCMLPSTFPFISLLVLVVFWMLSRKYEFTSDNSVKGHLKGWVTAVAKDTFTVQNVLGGGIIGILSFLYLSVNLSGTRVMQESEYGVLFENNLSKYLIFIILEAGVYFVSIYRYQKDNKLYYLILLGFLIIPPIKVGSGGDFCMRASIPLLFILMIMVMDTLEMARKNRDKTVMVSLIILLCIGSVTPIHEMVRSVKITTERINNSEQVYETSIDTQQLLNAPNFSGATDHSFFFKYIAK